jgi:xylan 1,4-beta-xylosidase
MKLRPLFLFGTLLLAWAVCAAGPAPATDAKSPLKTFRNPILPGFHPDPSICRVGGDFYLVNSTFEFFPGLPIYHSRDLVHWAQIGNALDRSSQLPLKGANDFGGLYAPTIRYWKGTFFLTCTNYNGRGTFIVKAQDPAGPWSEPVWMNDWNMDGSMFFDDDGKAYYTQHGGGEKAGIKQAEFDPETCLMTTTPKGIHNDLSESWNEGPHLYKIQGRYYLMVAEGGTGDRHMEWIGRSDSPWGPFEPCPYNPILTERDDPSSPIQCTGHADLVEAPDGSWWMVFLGVRPGNKGHTSVLGRETFLAPVAWKDGWPVVNGDHHVSLEMPAPKLEPHPSPETPVKWEFDGAKLGPEWIHVRNIDPADFSLSRRKGFLSLRAGEGSLDSKNEVPVFVGQRQSDFKVTVRCAMKFTPGADGEEAGLIVRANDDNHYRVGVGRHGGAVELFVSNRVKGYGCIVARRPFDGGKVWLELSGQEDQYQFAWSLDGKKWETLAASDASDLSKDKAGGFTGAALGMFATANGKASKTWADFDRFEMKPGVAPAPIALAARPTPTPLPSREAWRIRAGGDPMTDSTGNEWSADLCHIGGETAGGDTIEADRDPALYQTQRWGSDFSYVLPVLPGQYRVRLFFAETYVKKPGERIFDVLINGKKVLKDFEILKEADGFKRGIEKTFKDIIPDVQGNIRISFVAKVQNAKVCALEVVRTKSGEEPASK